MERIHITATACILEIVFSRHGLFQEKLEVDFAELTANYRNKTAILEQFESAQNELVYPELQPTDSQVQEMVRVFRDSSLENGDQGSYKIYLWFFDICDIVVL